MLKHHRPGQSLRLIHNRSLSWTRERERDHEKKRSLLTKELEFGFERFFVVEVTEVEEIVWVSLLKVIRGWHGNIHR